MNAPLAQNFFGRHSMFPWQCIENFLRFDEFQRPLYVISVQKKSLRLRSTQ
ncbi:MAG: hypothetical protein KME10_05080 [Plectolyngbya sp. WJT66-NPBG17]|nr:hypothetical protein [Plectolyngbya sp. WJT66-NPBG17]